MANLGEISNNESGEQAVSTPEPMILNINGLEPPVGVGLQEAAYTNVEGVRDFDNLTIQILADTAPTVIQVNSLITNMINVNSYITNLIKVSSEIQEEG